MIQYIFLRQVISLGNDTKKSYTIRLIVLAVLAICAVSILVFSLWIYHSSHKNTIPCTVADKEVVSYSGEGKEDEKQYRVDTLECGMLVVETSLRSLSTDPDDIFSHIEEGSLYEFTVTGTGVEPYSRPLSIIDYKEM